MTHLGSPHEAYDFVEQIGDGSFGTVHKAQHKISHKLVAVKVMKKKYSCIEDCQGQFEPKLLDLLPSHLNIVQLHDSFLCPTTCDLSFIMEYMDGGNLYQLMRERRHHNLPFNHCELRNILYQILSAVSHIHHHNVFHRDMKPENLLLDYSTGRPVIKLADFGLARELASSPPYTEYVSTRWYRAPEVLLRSTEYSAPVDLWAIGAIFAELITLEPLFPGESEIDQIYRICDILGSPGNKVVGLKSKVKRQEKRLSPGFARKKTTELSEPVNTTNTPSTLSPLDGGGEWKEGVKLAFKIGFKFPQLYPRPLETVITNATESMLDLIRHFLFFNPCQRWSADFALKHAFFSETDEPVHTIVPVADTAMQEIEPITPPDQPVAAKHITPLDLLPTPKTPYQVCPEWHTDHPVSRYGRLCSAVKEDPALTSSRGTHVDRFLHDTEPPVGDYLIQSRPIYSSHQKVHPITDRPNSSNLWNKYNYAAHQQLRPSTPIVDHRPIPTSSTSTSKLVSVHGDEQLDDNSHRRVGHHNPHHHHINPPNTHFSLDRIPHYGNQLIKWAPPQYAPPQYASPMDVATDETTRPESRRCRTPAPFSSQLMKHKYTSISHTTSNCHSFNTAPIKTWSPASTTTTSSVNTDKVLADQHFHHQYQRRKSDKPQSTHRNSTSHRFNLWVPANDEEVDPDEDNYPNENNNRSVVL